LCGAAFGALALVSTPAAAKLKVSPDDPAYVYVQARAAAIAGDHVRSAALLSSLAEAEPANVDLNRRALSEAVGAGDMALALRLARTIPANKLSSDARLLLVADELRRNRFDRALGWLSAAGDNGNLQFLAPLINAWAAADRRDLNGALAALDKIPANGLLSPLRDEQRALILLKFRRAADALPFAERAVETARGRENRLRMAFADGFLAAGDQASALKMIEGLGTEAASARQRILSRKASGLAIDTASEALSDAAIAFAADVARIQRAAPPIGLAQVARYADPKNSSAALLLALLLDGSGRSEDALAVLRTVPGDDSLIAQVRDVQVRILSDEKRFNEAYAIAAAAANARDAGINDWSRLGDVYQSMKRNNEGADAYGRAIAIARAQNLKDELWPLLLLQASALEEGKRWPEAKQSLQAGLAIAPEQPLLLNFLGYAKLERGEDLDSAEAMIAKASELAPDDASITDSLGWAQYKRGKVANAIETLQRAAEKDPDQAEIQEHLGDALFTSGRRFQARFAWNAALVTAEDEIAVRVKAKLASGLNPANAAP
jgi:tetratricopeptide (TPR) repeat protein